MNRRIIEARKIYSKALEEFERGYNNTIRDSAEKAWLSAVKAIDALIDSEGYEIPYGAGAHEFRNKVLLEWANTDPEIDELYDNFKCRWKLFLLWNLSNQTCGKRNKIKSKRSYR